MGFVVDKRSRKICRVTKDTIIKFSTILGVKPQRIIKERDTLIGTYACTRLRIVWMLSVI